MKKLLAFFACMAIFFSATAQEVTNDSLLNAFNSMKGYVCGLEKTVKKLSAGQSTLTKRQTELEKNQIGLTNEVNDNQQKTNDRLDGDDKAIDNLQIHAADVAGWINGIDTVAAKYDKPNKSFGQSYVGMIIGKKSYVSSKTFWLIVIPLCLISLFALGVGFMAISKKKHSRTIGSSSDTQSHGNRDSLL